MTKLSETIHTQLMTKLLQTNSDNYLIYITMLISLVKHCILGRFLSFVKPYLLKYQKFLLVAMESSQYIIIRN